MKSCPPARGKARDYNGLRPTGSKSSLQCTNIPLSCDAVHQRIVNSASPASKVNRLTSFNTRFILAIACGVGRQKWQVWSNSFSLEYTVRIHSRCAKDEIRRRLADSIANDCPCSAISILQVRQQERSVYRAVI